MYLSKKTIDIPQDICMPYFFGRRGFVFPQLCTWTFRFGKTVPVYRKKQLNLENRKKTSRTRQTANGKDRQKKQILDWKKIPAYNKYQNMETENEAMNGNITKMRVARDAVRNNRGLIQKTFLTEISGAVQDVLTANQMQINMMKQEISLMGNQTLHVHKRNGKNYFGSREIGTTKETSITNNDNLIHMLARRECLEKTITAIEHMNKLLGKVIDNSQEAVYEMQLKKKLGYFSDAGLDVTRILFTKEQNEWIDEPYSPNPYNVSSLKYRTISSIPVRSKSERGLGNMLEEVGLPYRSDDLVRIIGNDHGDQPFRDTYFADFKTPNLLGGITIHEHLGAFQIENYADNALKRLNDYHNFTVIELPNRPVKREEFTWSFENDLRDGNSLNKLLKRLLLPGLCW